MSGWIGTPFILNETAYIFNSFRIYAVFTAIRAVDEFAHIYSIYNSTKTGSS